MSDSELSRSAVPDDVTLERTLRQVIRNALKNSEEITVNSARTAAEAQLGLDSAFFKSTPAWKDRSKNIINAAVEEADDASSPERSKKSASKSKPAVAKAGAKRKSESRASDSKSKRRKESPTPDQDDDEDGVPSDHVSDEYEEPEPVKAPKKKAPPKKPTKKGRTKEEDEDDVEKEAGGPKKAQGVSAKSKAAIADSSGASDHDVDAAEPRDALEADTQATTDEVAAATRAKLSDPAKGTSHTNGAAPDADDSSDLSSVIDDGPPAKKRGKKAPAPSKAKDASKSKDSKASKATSPDEEEIKRLQSWLLKCGIRKLWRKELAPFDSSKAKMRHLKAMLADAGMGGRYSAEKAKSIKEARELAAELEAARDFEEQWGHEEEKGSGDEDVEEEKRPARRLVPRGLVDFGDSGDDSD